YGNECFRILKKGETLDRWYHTGIGCHELQSAALRLAGTNNTANRAYREAWKALADHVPDLRDMDAAARSNAVWLVLNWDTISAWLKRQPVNVRLSLNHPRSVKRKYEAATRPPSVANANGNPDPQTRSKDHLIMDLQEKLDAALAIRTGSGPPPNQSPEDWV